MSINSLIGALSPQSSGLTQLLNTVDQAAGGGKGNPDLNSLLGLSLGIGGAAINLGPSSSSVNAGFNFGGLDSLLNGTGLGMPSFVSSIFNNTPAFGGLNTADPMANIFSGAFGSTPTPSATGAGSIFGAPLLSSVFNNIPDFNSSFNTPLFGGTFANPFGNSGFSSSPFNNFNLFGSGGGFGFGMPPLLSGLMGQSMFSGFGNLFPMF